MDNINLNGKLVERYKGILNRIMPITIPALGLDEIDEAIDYSIQKRFKDNNCSINNNYKHKTVNTSIAQLTEYILDKEPIITSYGCMFMKHGTVKNPLYDMIEEIVTIRDNYKSEMFKYPKGSELFNKYNLLQLLAKVDANAIYGCLGNYSSMLYNLYVAQSITRQGKSTISASIMLFEELLSNNVLFGSLNEIIMFIDNTMQEKNDRKFMDSEILDRDITLAECFYKIMGTCGYNWVPTMDDGLMIWDILSRVSQEELNRLYYKNNMFEFCDNSKITSLLITILCKLKTPFLDPNKPPKEIEDELNLFIDYIREFVYYKYQIIDKLERVETMIRNVVLITDTDSCIISLEPWYRFILEKTKGIDMNIKHDKIDVLDYLTKDEFGDREKIEIVERIQYDYEYDFYNEEIIQKERLTDPTKVIPQDGLRHSIINIMSYAISKLILEYMYKYTENHHSAAPNRKCLLIMKNEFLFKSILLTDGKKNYASIQEVQEGNIVPKEKVLAISGLPLDKVGIASSTSKELKRILYEDILDSENGVDQVKVLNQLAVLEKRIFDSINSGETKYHKPARIKPLTSYELPMRIQGIKASVAYNALRCKGEEAIDLEKRNSVLIIKVNVDKNTIKSLIGKDDEMYAKMLNLISTPEFKGEITSVAIPYGIDIPKWLIPFIDYTTIIHDNLSNFPIESIGIQTLNSKSVPYSNILEF